MICGTRSILGMNSHTIQWCTYLINIRAVLFVTGVVLGCAGTSSAEQPLSQAKKRLEPFLKKYCVGCHGAETQEGQVRFDQVSWEINNNNVAQRWQDVLDQLNGGDMPPEDADQPTDDELAQALSSLTGAVLEARRRLTDHGGEITLRRLNKREYSNTIRDLFGFEVSPDDIPDDGEIATFDTVGSEQLFTSSHFEKYLDLGKRVAMDSFQFNLSRRKGIKAERTQPERRVTKRMRSKLADLDRKMEMKKAGSTWQQMGFKDEGEMEIIFRQWDARAEVPRRYLQYPLVESGVYICDVAKWASAAMHTDIRGDYIVRIHGGVQGDPDDLRRIVRLYNRQRILGTLRIDGTPENPQTVEMRVRQSMGRSHFSTNVRENVPENTINSMRGYLNKLQGPGERNDPRAAVWVDWIEIEGPYYSDERPKWERILYGDSPTGSRSPYIWDDGKIRELIEKFAFEAFRRQVPEPEYIDALHAIYEENRAVGQSQRDALVEVMGIVLASPGFLFLQEEAPAVQRRDVLTNRELAVRLSYFLWSSPPDEELYAADLSDAEQYTKQVDRMLESPKAIAFRDGFISQWSELDRYDAITVDNRQFIRFNEGVRQDAKQEVREFFGTLIDENLPASNLIDSEFVMVNSALAVHYGLDLSEFSGSGFRKIKLPADSARGGLMTQTAFLATGSNGERSSPVIRGALVMEKLLHDKPAPPPPNVPELGSASKRPRTNREMVELHQKQAVCSSCHKKMDVIGFGLENFDTIGRWRDTEKVGNRQVTIEPGGTLPDGLAFQDVQELKAALLEHEEDVAEELVESILAYALGRTIEFSDSDDVEAIMDQVRDEQFRVRSLIREVALSPLFKSRG